MRSKGSGMKGVDEMKAFTVEQSEKGNTWNPIGQVFESNQQGLNVVLSSLPMQREIVIFSREEADQLVLQGLPQNMKVMLPEEYTDRAGNRQTRWTELGRAWRQTQGCKIRLSAIPLGKRLVLLPLQAEPAAQDLGAVPEQQAPQDHPGKPLEVPPVHTQAEDRAVPLQAPAKKTRATRKKTGPEGEKGSTPAPRKSRRSSINN